MPPLLKCPLCESSFPDKPRFFAHVDEHDLEVGEVKDDDDDDDDEEPEEDGERQKVKKSYES